MRYEDGQRPSLQFSSPCQHIRLALVGPIFGPSDKAGPHRVCDHVGPLRGITFAPSQLRVPEMARPDRQVFAMRPLPCRRCFPESHPVLQGFGTATSGAQNRWIWSGMINYLPTSHLSARCPDPRRISCISAFTRTGFRSFVQTVTKTMIGMLNHSYTGWCIGCFRPGGSIMGDLEGRPLGVLRFVGVPTHQRD
jgi:hypothetical protein